VAFSPTATPALKAAPALPLLLLLRHPPLRLPCLPPLLPLLLLRLPLLRPLRVGVRVRQLAGLQAVVRLLPPTQVLLCMGLERLVAWVLLGWWWYFWVGGWGSFRGDAWG
jgi:hypothetical protein